MVLLALRETQVDRDGQRGSQPLQRLQDNINPELVPPPGQPRHKLAPQPPPQPTNPAPNEIHLPMDLQGLAQRPHKLILHLRRPHNPDPSPLARQIHHLMGQHPQPHRPLIRPDDLQHW